MSLDHRGLPAARAREFFDDLWAQGDYWRFETSPYERDRYARQLVLLGQHRYRRVLEIGCGAGVFTRLLAERADAILAIDVAPAAIARALSHEGTPPHVQFRAANIMELDPAAEGPWDLIVLSETVYYLGWLYPFYDVGWLAAQLFGATADDGRLLLVNLLGRASDLSFPALIRTYHDLFRNVGYELDHEETFQGEKNSVVLENLISLFHKPARST